MTPKRKQLLKELSTEYGAKVYDRDEFRNNQEFKDICVKASHAWQEMMEKRALELGGDSGSCVGGVGFKIWILDPRSKNPRSTLILVARGWQGSLVAGYGHEEIKKMLKDAGMDCWFDEGYMN